jgi:hypothetical protein
MPVWKDGIVWRSGLAVGHFGMPEAPAWLRSGVTVLASLGGAMTVAVAARRAWHALRGGQPSAVTLTIVAACSVAAVLFAPLLVMPTRFDRYLLPIIPSIIALVLVSGDDARCVGRRSPALRWSAVAAALLLAASATFAIIATRDAFAEERARLSGLNDALALGYPRDQINAGWVLNGWHLYAKSARCGASAPSGAGTTSPPSGSGCSPHTDTK